MPDEILWDLVALRELDESDYNVVWGDPTLCDICRGDHKNPTLWNCQNLQFWNFISIISVTLFYYMGVLWHEFNANWYNIKDDIEQTICIDASANTKVQKCKCTNLQFKARNRYLQLWKNQEPILTHTPPLVPHICASELGQHWFR